MKVHIEPRQSGERALGAYALIPLALLPVGAWLVDTGALNLGVCSFKRYLGIPCMTCGATRATVHLFHGHLWDALKTQPFIVSVYLGMLVLGTVSLGAKLTRRSVRVEISDREDLVLKAVLIGFPVLNWIYLWVAGI